MYGGTTSEIRALVTGVDYVFAVIGMIMFRKNDPVHFGHMSTALMTVWCMETLDWTGVLYINMLGCDEVRANLELCCPFYA